MNVGFHQWDETEMEMFVVDCWTLIKKKKSIALFSLDNEPI